MNQSAGVGVFEHPQGAVGGFFHIADSFADIPALGGLGSAFAVEQDADDRMARRGR